MKQLFSPLIALLLLCGTAPAQSLPDTIVLKAGTDGYVTVNGQNFPRGYLMTVYKYRTSDSLLGLMYANDRTYFIKPQVNRRYQFGDTANKPAFNMLTLRSWMNTYLENK